MAESKILQALRTYKEQYAWDKSLLGSAVTSSSAPVALMGASNKLQEYTNIPQEHTNTALEDFTNGFSSR